MDVAADARSPTTQRSGDYGMVAGGAAPVLPLEQYCTPSEAPWLEYSLPALTVGLGELGTGEIAVGSVLCGPRLWLLGTPGI